MARLAAKTRLPRAAFLALALLLHGALLLVPLAPTGPAKAPGEPLQVTFEVPVPPQPPEPPYAPPDQPASPAPAAPALADPDPPPEARERSEARPPSRAPGEEERPEPPRVVDLHRALGEGHWKAPDSPARPATIGRSTESALLERLRRPVLAYEPTVFDRFALPSSTEIVDRWQGPGGAYRVVIRTPGGETLCGRQEPMDEFRPWLQMPVMFHRCAGGGQRER